MLPLVVQRSIKFIGCDYQLLLANLNAQNNRAQALSRFYSKERLLTADAASQPRTLLQNNGLHGRRNRGRRPLWTNSNIRVTFCLSESQAYLESVRCLDPSRQSNRFQSSTC